MNDSKASAFDDLLSAFLRWQAINRPPKLAEISAPLARRLTELDETISDAALKVLLVSESGRAAVVLLEPDDGSRAATMLVLESSGGEPLH